MFRVRLTLWLSAALVASAAARAPVSLEPQAITLLRPTQVLDGDTMHEGRVMKGGVAWR